MTNEEKRIAIARECGWLWHGDESWPKTPDCPYWKLGDKTYQLLPDYPNALDAMHEAEECLRQNQFHYVDYFKNLFFVVTGLRWEGQIGYFGFNLIIATASQRADAFLLTKGYKI